jgi:hypothetical protein
VGPKSAFRDTPLQEAGGAATVTKPAESMGIKATQTLSNLVKGGTPPPPKYHVLPPNNQITRALKSII